MSKVRFRISMLLDGFFAGPSPHRAPSVLLAALVTSTLVACQPARRATMVEIIGVHPVEARQPCHLVELRLRGVETAFDFADFTQEVPGQPPSNWQVPWMECILNADGTQVLAVDTEIPDRPGLLRGDVRLTFFFHDLDESRPLSTPFGKVRLPRSSERPERLAMIQYEEVD